MTAEREHSYSVTRIRSALRKVLSPRMVEEVLAELGEEKRRASRRPTPSAEDHAEAARLLRRHGIQGK